MKKIKTKVTYKTQKTTLRGQSVKNQIKQGIIRIFYKTILTYFK